jgi:N-methylhydantoinase B
VNASVDAITLEVIKNALESIADEMAIALMRSAYSAVVRDSLDFSTAFCDRDGRMVAQGLTTPLHLGSFPDAMRFMIQEYGGQLRDGDVYILNDPYTAAGTHLPDIYVIKPVFWLGDIEGFATTLVHHVDMGGIAPGSNSVFSTEIFQDGLRIPLLKLYDGGRPNDTLLKILETNVRLPVQVLGDLRAQLAACHHAERSFLRLLQRYGAATMRRYLEELHDYAERLMRAGIRALPDGVYAFTDYIDGLGENPEPLRFQVHVEIRGDDIYIDWAGSAPQVKAGINAPMSFTRSAAYLVIRCLMGAGIPNAEGYMRPIHVTAPPGTIMNPVLPGPCSTRGITGFRMVDTLFGALAQAVPDRVPAAGEGGATFPSIGGYYEDRPFIHTESILGTWGGRPGQDGTEGISHPAANQSNQPVEIVEVELPLEFLQYGLVPDTGGAGRYRGGLSIVREYRVMAEGAVLSMRSDRRTHLPYGLQGGRPGTPSWNIINPGPQQRILPTLPMEGVALRKCDVLRHVLAGGGGYGDPLERDPQRVLGDVLDEKLTPGYAHREYGVVVRVDDATVDEAATIQLRAEMRRGAAAPPTAVEVRGGP